MSVDSVPDELHYMAECIVWPPEWVTGSWGGEGEGHLLSTYCRKHIC